MHWGCVITVLTVWCAVIGVHGVRVDSHINIDDQWAEWLNPPRDVDDMTGNLGTLTFDVWRGTNGNASVIKWFIAVELSEKLAWHRFRTRYACDEEDLYRVNACANLTDVMSLSLDMALWNAREYRISIPNTTGIVFSRRVGERAYIASGTLEVDMDDLANNELDIVVCVPFSLEEHDRACAVGSTLLGDLKPSAEHFADEAGVNLHTVPLVV